MWLQSRGKLIRELDLCIRAWYVGRQTSVSKMEDGIQAAALITICSPQVSMVWKPRVLWKSMIGHLLSQSECSPVAMMMVMLCRVRLLPVRISEIIRVIFPTTHTYIIVPFHWPRNHLGEIEWFTQGHTAGKWQTRCWNSWLPVGDLRNVLLPLCVILHVLQTS